MKVRLWAAIAGPAIVLAASGSGGTAAESPAPAYGMVSSMAGGAQTLVRVDPGTLKPLAGGLAIPEGFAFGARSPDGRSAAFFSFRRPSLRVVDLEGLKSRGDIALAPAGWRARAAAWLTADRVAVVVQRMRGSYGQIVDRREVVLVDPLARRVVARRQIAGAMALTTSASGGDKLVLLLGRGDARTRIARVAVVDSSGAVRSVDVDLGVPQGLRLPSLVVERSGSRAFVIAAGAPAVEVDLNSLVATPHMITGGGAVLADSPLGSRQALLLDGGILAVTGHNSRQDRGVQISRPAGLAFVDTSTWQARLVDQDVSNASVSGDTLVGSSFRIERVQRDGRPAQKVVGIGLRAYSADGTRRWQRFGAQALTANAFRDSALVYRHPSPPIGWAESFVVDLDNGRQIGRNLNPRQNFSLLPDVPGARPVRVPAAATAEALQVEGGADEFRGTVEPEVTRVVAVLVDGSERELAIEAGSVTYRAATPHESSRTVQAFAGDELVASVSLPVACGGSAGPCASAEPVAGGTFAVLRTPGGTSLAEIDAKTLAPLPGRSVAVDRSTSAHALSADGGLAAVGSYENATVRVFETARLDRAELVAPLAPGNAGVRAIEWLAPTRLVAIVQKYKRRDRRAVSARELVVLDPQTHRVVRRTVLPIGRAIVDVQASGGRLVAILRSSNHRGTGITVVVASAHGGVRSREIRLRETDGVLPETRMTLERGGKRAFLFAWQPSGAAGPQPLREINLDRLTVTRREVTIAKGRFYRPSGFSAWAESFGDSAVLISGAYVPLFRDGRHVPAAGIFIVDTRTFQIRQLDARATAFVIAGDRAYTFGSTILLGATPPRGIGVAAYDTNGKRLYRGFGTRTFTRLVVAGGYGHLLRGDRTSAVAFELASGRSLGTSATPNADIEVLEPAAPASLTSAPTRRPSATTTPAAPAVVTADPFTRVSNRGTRVEPKATRPGEREQTPRDIFLLRRDLGRAVYRIGGLKPGFSSCYASGPGNDIGRLGTIICGRNGFPSRLDPLQTMSVMQSRRGAKNPQLYRLEGVAVDAIAEIGLTDAGRKVIQRVPVRDNVYVLARPPATATGGLVAYDTRGEVVFRSDQRQQRPAAPPPATSPRRLAGYRLKITLPEGWSGEIRGSGSGTARAALFAGNGLPARDPRSVSLALIEHDPRARPAFQRVVAPPQLRISDIRLARSNQGRVERNFTFKGRQFSLQLGLGTPRPSAKRLAEINGALATLSVGAIAVPPTIANARTRLQRGSDEGVSVDVFRSGIVVFRFDPTSRLYRQLQGKQLSVSCLTFDSLSPWEPNQSGFSNRTLAETVQIIFSDTTRPQPPYATVDPATEAKPPFDGCLVSGSYGRRWNDPRGQHSPAEIAFTAAGKRFFDERAVARDLALFVRSPKLAAARRSLKQGGSAPTAAALTRGLPARVVALAARSRLPAAGEIGVWSNRRGTIEVSARSSTGKRLFIELRSGRIARHNLEGLAFVF